MVRFREERDGRDDDVDFMDPFVQNAPVSRAILDLLRKLTDRFRDMPAETSDMGWTAFKALSSAGAAEGIVRLTCTYADAEGPSTEYYHVRGNGLSDMPARQFLTTEPHEFVLAKARLTTTGVQWAQYLAAERAQPEKVRGLVLTLLWKAEKQPGSAHRVPPPSDESAPAHGHADVGDSASDMHVVGDVPVAQVPSAATTPSAVDGVGDGAAEAAAVTGSDRRYGNWDAARVGKAINAYIEEHWDRYIALGRDCLVGKKGAVKALGKFFGPSAIAAAINSAENITDPKLTCARSHISGNAAYLDRIKPLREKKPRKPVGWPAHEPAVPTMADDIREAVDRAKP